jgi:hypothetical protein
MAAPNTYSGSVQLPAEAPARTTGERDDRGMLERWRERSAQRKRRRLVSARSRRVHAQWLRSTANRADDPDPFRRRREALLHYRAAAVRTDLLELAAELERTHEPDPACMAELHDLLANGCDSPLFNAKIAVEELHATIRRVRAGLVSQPYA